MVPRTGGWHADHHRLARVALERRPGRLGTVAVDAPNLRRLGPTLPLSQPGGGCAGLGADGDAAGGSGDCPNWTLGAWNYPPCPYEWDTCSPHNLIPSGIVLAPFAAFGATQSSDGGVPARDGDGDAHAGTTRDADHATVRSGLRDLWTCVPLAAGADPYPAADDLRHPDTGRNVSVAGGLAVPLNSEDE